MIAALLFDFDGLIVDTEVATFQSWRDTYADYGVDLALDDWLPAVGTGTSTAGAFDAVAHLEKLIGTRVDRDAVVARRARRKAELYVRAPVLPGVRERLDEARKLGLRTAIVTRNHEVRVTAKCAAVGLDHPWDAIVCANDTPTADKTVLYRRALAILRARADEALAFEDSPSGVHAAKGAELRCVAVPNEITRSAPFHEADAVLSSLAERPLDEILALFAA